MEDCINLEELNLVNYLRQSEERLLKSAWRRRNRSELEHPNDYKRRKHENKTLRSVHFGVFVVEQIKCKCGGIARNEIW